MQKIIKLSISLLVICCFSFASVDMELIGEWKSVVDGEEGFMTFESGGYAYITMDGQKQGGKSFDMDGDTASLTFETNTASVPRTIDLIIKNKKQEEIRLLGIYEFINKDKVRICMASDEKARPTNFKDNPENVIVFDRIK